MEFANRPFISQRWTTDRRRSAARWRDVNASGGTAMYDAVADALPLAERDRTGRRRCSSSRTATTPTAPRPSAELRQLIRESEVLVYALGVDGTGRTITRSAPPPMQLPIPFPFPGRAAQGGRVARNPRGGDLQPARSRNGERVNADALRQMTDDTGGRTEIVRGFGDLDGATARIADELSKQYLPRATRAAARRTAAGTPSAST